MEILKTDWFDPENENFDLTMEDLEKNKSFLMEQRELGNPNYQYKGNCTKKFAEKICDKYFDREWEWVKNHDLPESTEFPTSDKMMENEIKTLVKEQKSFKTRSPIIKKFHPSALKASREGHLSPFDGWKHLQEDKDAFRKFYLKRLRCSDWYNEYKKGKEDYKAHWSLLLESKIPPFIYCIGLTTSGKYMNVSMFKPHCARYLVKKYLNNYSEVFDPFSGFSGRLLGTVACNKKYIGRDLSQTVINESIELIKFASPVFSKMGINPDYDMKQGDVTQNTGKYQCLLTCSPYGGKHGGIERWDGVPDSDNSCDDWIDICLKNYECDRYVFVTDDNIQKYKPYVKEELQNTCHWGSNKEYVVVIDKTCCS